MRVIIDLTEEQLERLRRVSERKGISRAEAVRRAVDVAYGRGGGSTGGEARVTAFGVWRKRPEDALTYVDRLRAEWDERETELGTVRLHGRVAERKLGPKLGSGKRSGRRRSPAK